MKKVLIITYYWPPSGGSGVQRWVKFAKYLPLYGWEPIIYIPSNPQYTSIDKSLLNDIPPGVKIIKRPIFEVYNLYKTFIGKKNKPLQGNPITSKNNGWKDKIALAIRGNVFIPDPRIMWKCPSVKFLTKWLKSNPVDMIISTGPPHSIHLIARKVALNTQTPWIADFRDPWTKIFYFKHLPLLPFIKRKYEKLEQKVLDDATAVIAVSPLVQKDFATNTQTPIHLITNGYDDEDFKQTIEKDSYFNITHAGLLVNDGNPKLLWKVLGAKVNTNPIFAKYLKIRLVGKVDEGVIKSIIDNGLQNHLVNLGYQSHQVAIKEMLNASVLVLPIRTEPETKAILPGKLFEYLAASKPILGIADPLGAMAHIINETKCGIVCNWTEEDKMSNFIDQCWNSFNACCKQNINISIDKYSRKNLTAKLAELMNSLLK